MITAEPGTILHMICKDVDRMKPGQYLRVSLFELREIPSYWHNEAEFTPADRVLGNIVGSAYTHSYQIDYEQAYVTFMRHEEKPGVRHYASPDRRN